MVKFKKDLTTMQQKSIFSSILQLLLILGTIYMFSRFACARKDIPQASQKGSAFDYSVHREERLLIAKLLCGNINEVVDNTTCLSIVEKKVNYKLDSLQTILDRKVASGEIDSLRAKRITEVYVKTLLGIKTN